VVVAAGRVVMDWALEVLRLKDVLKTVEVEFSCVDLEPFDVYRGCCASFSHVEDVREVCKGGGRFSSGWVFDGFPICGSVGVEGGWRTSKTDWFWRGGRRGSLALCFGFFMGSFGSF